MEAMNNQQISPDRIEHAEYEVGRAIALDHSSQLQVPQHALLDYLSRIAVALESTIPLNLAPVQKPRVSGTAIVPGLSSEDRTTLKDLKGDFTQVKTELAQIKEILSAERGEVVKEAYTVEEVAGKTKYKPFTIRQACNKRRIKEAYKGRDHAWRIPHASLLDILSNGLPSE
jgi:hypothetical protein